MKPSDLSVRHHYAMINGAQFHYVEAGEGPLVLLLHGFPEMWWCWRHQIPALARAGYRVIAPDLRGYNDTEKKGPYDIDTLACDVLGLIRHAGEKSAIIVGHDWGGAISWHFAIHHPEACRKLAVLNCPHPAQLGKALRSKPKQLRMSWYMFAFQVPGIPERLLTRRNGALIAGMFRKAAVDPTHFGREEIAPLRAAICKPGAAKAALGYYRASFASRLLNPAKSARAPSKVACPTLLVWAKDDVALDYDSLVPGTERYVPRLELKTLERCGHFVQEEQPEKVNELLLGFLGADSRDST